MRVCLEQRQFLGLEEARQVLAELGVVLNPRQMKRAADRDSEGRRKLPFFIDPIDGTLKIERQALIDVYVKRQTEAQRQWQPRP